jgi:hypothetical protein
MIGFDLYFANQSHPNSKISQTGVLQSNGTIKTANKSESNQLKENHRRAFSEFRVIKSQESQKLQLSSNTKPSTNFQTTTQHFKQNDTEIVLSSTVG